MTTLNYSVQLAAGTAENVNDVMTNFNDARGVINGNIDNTNIAAGAGIVDTKLASPNNSAYRTIFGSRAEWDQSIIQAGTYLLTPSAAAGTGIDNGSSSATSAGPAISVPIWYFAAADFAVTGLTTKLRVRANIGCNATAPAITFTFGLYPVTIAGAAASLALTLGTVVAGTTVAIASPSASTVTQGNSGDATIPADGAYVLGVTTSAAMPANSAALLNAWLQVRNV